MHPHKICVVAVVPAIAVALAGAAALAIGGTIVLAGAPVETLRPATAVSGPRPTPGAPAEPLRPATALSGPHPTPGAPAETLLPATAVSGPRPTPGAPAETLLPATALSGPSPTQPKATATAVASAVATTPGEIRGIVTSPKLGDYNPADPTPCSGGTCSIFAFTFAGSLNAHPDQWFIAVDALKSADADPTNEANWQYNVATFDATGGGPEVFDFSADVAPFASLPGAWKTGGLGRVRVVAAMDADPNQWAVLPVQDFDGITPANATTLVFSDTSPDPTKPPGQTEQSITDPLNTATPNYLSVNNEVLSFPPGQLAQQRAATNAYYDQIKTNKDGTGLSIRQKIPTLKKFIDHYFRPFECSTIVNEPARVTKYFNNGDLGLGREMHCINRGCTEELACYVRNFVGKRADGKLAFGDMAKAKTALLNNRPFATVAMVERELIARDAPNRVFFVVYLQNPGTGGPESTTLGLEAPLDNKGYNTSIPGNCLQCHGVNSRYTAHGVAHRVSNAMFLPFDLDAFKFFSTDQTNSLSLAKQQAAFRSQNRMVRSFSSNRFSPNARELIAGWYGGDMFNGTFNGGFVPGGWQGGPNERQLYSKTYAVGCRTCHVSYVPSATDNRQFLAFSTFAEFAQLARSAMCGSTGNARRMPAAEQTLKVLWRSGKGGRPHYFGQVPAAFGDCGLTP